MDLVSIIIPVYNVAHWLPKCLESCINQTYQNLEIIAVNDGSTDKSLEIISNYESKDERIIIINKINGGLNSSRKSGIELASGKYFTILDGDDYFELNAIETFVNKAIKSNSDIIIAGANIVLAENNKIINHISHSKKELYGLDYLKSIIAHGPNTVCMKLYRKTINNETIDYPNIKAGQDFPITIQWALNSNKVFYISDILYNYVVAREGSTMSGDRNVYVESSFKAYHFGFKILIKQRKIEQFHNELTNSTCAKLYNYLYNDLNKYHENKLLVKEMASFVWQKRKFLMGNQFIVFSFLLQINLTLAHWFVAIMQRIRPSLNQYTK